MAIRNAPIEKERAKHNTMAAGTVTAQRATSGFLKSGSLTVVSGKKPNLLEFGIQIPQFFKLKFCLKKQDDPERCGGQTGEE
jgi:hypothetical protein